MVCRIPPAKDEYPDFGGTRLVGQNLSLIKINIRNELFSNYHKFKKILEIKIYNFEIFDIFKFMIAKKSTSDFPNLREPKSWE